MLKNTQRMIEERKKQLDLQNSSTAPAAAAAPLPAAAGGDDADGPPFADKAKQLAALQVMHDGAVGKLFKSRGFCFHSAGK